MQLIRTSKNFPTCHRGCVATIGNFDGVHRGHQHIIATVKAEAEKTKRPTLAIIFEPQPREFFSPESAPARLTRWREKIYWLAHYGIEKCVTLRFNNSLAALPAEAFIDELLVQQLGIHQLIVGKDFRFGQGRHGDVALIQQHAKQQQFQVKVLNDFAIEDQRISSSVIRHALAVGDLLTAKQYLGRDYSICGHVIHGDKRGREWGVPTANIPLLRLHSPLHGIFTVYCKLRGKRYPGVASLGTRPAVGGTKPLLEVHLLDFNKTLYGQMIAVEFLQKLRDESDFDSITALKQQIYADVDQARAYFTRHDHD